MSDPPVEWRRGEFIVSTDRSLIDQAAALALLRTTFWASGLDLNVLAAPHPRRRGAYAQVGFTVGPRR